MLLSLQIRNIQNVIRLTKENLEALNEQFGTDQHPPSIYLQVSESADSALFSSQGCVGVCVQVSDDM